MADTSDPPGLSACQSWSSALKDYRLTHKIKQDTLALDLGVTQAMVSRWESGRAEPRPEMQERILKLLEQKELSVPMVGWRQYYADQPGLAAVIDRDGVIETVSVGLARELALSREKIEGRLLSDLISGDLLRLQDAVRAAGFFDGTVEYVESADWYTLGVPGADNRRVRVHGLHWPRRDRDQNIRWLVNGACVDEAEFARLREELGGQFAVTMNKMQP